MSLTGELDKKDSPVTRWFDHWLANAAPIGKEWNATVRPVPIQRPVTAGRVPGTVGTAFDYRLRYYLAVTPLERLVAANGLRLIDPARLTKASRGASDAFLDPHGAAPEAAASAAGLAGDFEQGLAATLARLAPVGRALDDDAEELLCRYCYLLALFEELFRAGLAINSPLFALKGGGTDRDDLLALAPPVWVDDLCALSRAFVPHLAEFSREPLHLNPTFAGSGLVGGADADLIAGHCLIDVKTTVDPKFARKRLLYQLLGYVLLDFDDSYAIDAVGIYLSRQSLLVRWQLAALLETLLDERQASLAEMRASFRDAVTAGAGDAAAAVVSLGELEQG